MCHSVCSKAGKYVWQRMEVYPIGTHLCLLTQFDGRDSWSVFRRASRSGPSREASNA